MITRTSMLFPPYVAHKLAGRVHGPLIQETIPAPRDNIYAVMTENKVELPLQNNRSEGMQRARDIMETDQMAKSIASGKYQNSMQKFSEARSIAERTAQASIDFLA